MSLNQKYTWHDFLREHPEMKEKGVKRTSAEGKKAFEKAYKERIKQYLSERGERIDVDLARKAKRREEQNAKLKAAVQTKKKTRVKLAQRTLGRTDAAIARTQKMAERHKAVQKGFK